MAIFIIELHCSEQDLENVLQTPSVFLNVSKGSLASKEDLEKSFKTTEERSIILEVRLLL